MAGLSLKEEGRASWLRLADEWNKLAEAADNLRSQDREKNRRVSGAEEEEACGHVTVPR